MSEPTVPQPLLKSIPDQRTVRNHLGQLLRETRLLRRLLKLAKAIDDERNEQRQGGAA